MTPALVGSCHINVESSLWSRCWWVAGGIYVSIAEIYLSGLPNIRRENLVKLRPGRHLTAGLQERAQSLDPIEPLPTLHRSPRTMSGFDLAGGSLPRVDEHHPEIGAGLPDEGLRNPWGAMDDGQQSGHGSFVSARDADEVSDVGAASSVPGDPCSEPA